MYKCQVTGKISEPGEKLHKLVVKTRSKAYRGKIYNEETRSYEDYDVGVGTEIVAEINASEEGLLKWAKMDELDKGYLLKKLKIS